MDFTPLISPAVTPLETQLRYSSGYEDAFSPLTSPALHAQPLASQSSVYGGVRRSDTSVTTSPLHPTHGPTSTSAPGSVRRSRRKTSNNAAKNPARSVKQSPAMKPQHKKRQSSSAIVPSKEIASIIEKANSETRPNGIAGMLTAPEVFQTDSVSPESLSEILMPPPATPQSSSSGSGRSPQLEPMRSDIQAHADKIEEPATPASLMRIRKQAGRSSARKRHSGLSKDSAASVDSSMDQIMEDTALPDEASTNQSKQVASQSKGTSLITSGTSEVVNVSTIASPSASTVTSPIGPKPRKGADVKSMSREPKKRTTAGSEKASPALRPKISPSIKPLLPEGGKVMSLLCMISNEC